MMVAIVKNTVVEVNRRIRFSCREAGVCCKYTEKAVDAEIEVNDNGQKHFLSIGWGNATPEDLVLHVTEASLFMLYLYEEMNDEMGVIRLEELNAHTIQQFYYNLLKPTKERPEGLSAKTIKNIHGVLHKSLQQAVLVGYLHFNPADACTLPRIKRKELSPLDDAEITAFLTAIQGHRFETLYTVTYKKRPATHGC